MTTQNTLTAPAPLDKTAYVPDNQDWRFEVTFDFADATYSVQERHQSENMTPFYNWHGHAHSYELPSNADASKFEAWINEDVQPILDRIKAGYTSEWGGSNHVARFDEDAVEAKQELETLFYNTDGQVPTLSEGEGYWDASDWLDNAFLDILVERGITAESTDSELDDAAEKIDADALGENVKLSGTRNWLDWQREQLIDKADADAE